MGRFLRIVAGHTGLEAPFEDTELGQQGSCRSICPAFNAKGQIQDRHREHDPPVLKGAVSGVSEVHLYGTRQAASRSLRAGSQARTCAQIWAAGGTEAQESPQPLRVHLSRALPLGPR